MRYQVGLGINSMKVNPAFLLSVGFLGQVPNFLDIFGLIMVHLGHFFAFFGNMAIKVTEG